MPHGSNRLNHNNNNDSDDDDGDWELSIPDDHTKDWLWKDDVVAAELPLKLKTRAGLAPDRGAVGDDGEDRGEWSE